jgi:hypothetical protein
VIFGVIFFDILSLKICYFLVTFFNIFWCGFHQKLKNKKVMLLTYKDTLVLVVQTVPLQWGLVGGSWLPEKPIYTPSLKRWGDSRHSISFSAPHKLKGARRASKF